MTTAYDDLCAAFDAATEDGQAMQHYTKLLERAVDAIAATFQRRMASTLQSSRSAVLPALAEQVQASSDFELVTWLVVGCRQEDLQQPVDW